MDCSLHENISGFSVFSICFITLFHFSVYAEHGRKKSCCLLGLFQKLTLDIHIFGSWGHEMKIRQEDTHNEKEEVRNGFGEHQWLGQLYIYKKCHHAGVSSHSQRSRRETVSLLVAMSKTTTKLKGLRQQLGHLCFSLFHVLDICLVFDMY